MLLVLIGDMKEALLHPRRLHHHRYPLLPRRRCNHCRPHTLPLPHLLLRQAATDPRLIQCPRVHPGEVAAAVTGPALPLHRAGLIWVTTGWILYLVIIGLNLALMDNLAQHRLHRAGHPAQTIPANGPRMTGLMPAITG